MKFLCRLIGHDWSWYDRSRVEDARIVIEYIGQCGLSPALTRIIRFKTYRRVCVRCEQPDIGRELCEGVHEEWAR